MDLVDGMAHGAGADTPPLEAGSAWGRCACASCCRASAAAIREQRGGASDWAAERTEAPRPVRDPHRCSIVGGSAASSAKSALRSTASRTAEAIGPRSASGWWRFWRTSRSTCAICRDPDPPPGVDQQSDVDAITGHELHGLQQLAARGHFAGQRRQAVRQLGEEAPQQRLGRELGHAPPVRGSETPPGGAGGLAVEALGEPRNAGLAHQRAQNAAGEVGRRTPRSRRPESTPRRRAPPTESATTRLPCRARGRTRGTAPTGRAPRRPRRARWRRCRRWSRRPPRPGRSRRLSTSGMSVSTIGPMVAASSRAGRQTDTEHSRWARILAAGKALWWSRFTRSPDFRSSGCGQTALRPRSAREGPGIRRRPPERSEDPVKAVTWQGTHDVRVDTVPDPKDRAPRPTPSSA